MKILKIYANDGFYSFDFSLHDNHADNCIVYSYEDPTYWACDGAYAPYTTKCIQGLIKKVHTHFQLNKITVNKRNKLCTE